MRAIVTFDSNIKGTIIFKPWGDNIHITVNLSGFKKNQEHAMHIHEYGDLRQGCTSLGGHYNPGKKKHGDGTTSKSHAGDLINNIQSDNHGNVQISFVNKNIPSIKAILGRSIVIHVVTDDLGKQGRKVGSKFVKYDQMNSQDLQKFYFLSYTDKVSLSKMRTILMESSLETGNAGKRMACAIIGLQNPDIL